jgi:hypothetical protein
MWYSGFSATTTQSTSTPGIFTWRGLSAALGDALHLGDDDAAELRAAMAMAWASSVRASFSIVMLPSGSAVVPRMMPTWIGKAL